MNRVVHGRVAGQDGVLVGAGGETRFEDYRESPHHWNQSVLVHTFRPTVRRERWYIKDVFRGDRRGRPASDVLKRPSSRELR